MPSFFMSTMNYLQPNTAGQKAYFTIQDARRDLPAFTDVLVEFENATSGEKYRFIADVEQENERYTEVNVDTSTDDQLNSAVQITETGQFFVRIYGQNSDTNLDPNNAAVVGVIEMGVLRILTEEEFYTRSETTDTPSKIYYE